MMVLYRCAKCLASYRRDKLHYSIFQNPVHDRKCLALDLYLQLRFTLKIASVISRARRPAIHALEHAHFERRI